MYHYHSPGQPLTNLYHPHCWLLVSLLWIFNLNDNTLTLGSETSGLTVGSPITLDQADEQILANAADLTLKGLLSVDDGSISSDNASLKITGGINQTGGQLKLNNAQLELAGDISKTGGTLQTSDTETTVSADMKIRHISHYRYWLIWKKLISWALKTLAFAITRNNT